MTARKGHTDPMLAKIKSSWVGVGLLLSRRESGKATSQRPPIMTGFSDPTKRVTGWRRRSLYAALAIMCFFYSAFVTLLPRPLMVPLLIPLLLLVLAVIWALPVSNYRPFKSMDTLLWVYFGTVLLWPNYLALQLPGLPWLTAARLSLTPLLFLVLIASSSCAAYRTQMKEMLDSLRPVGILVTVFAIVQVLSIVLSDQPFTTINRVFNNETAWTMVFFAAVWTFRNQRSLERWCLAFVGMAVILTGIAFAEAQAEQVLWSQSIPAFLKPDDEAVAFLLQGYRRLTGEYRVIATAATPLGFAELLALSIPFVLYIGDRYRTFWAITLALVLDVIILVAIWLTYSRLGLVGFVASHLLFFFYLAFERRKKNAHSLAAASLLYFSPIVAAIGVAVIMLSTRLRTRVFGGSEHRFSNDARADQWATGIEKIWASPLFGFGANQGGRRLGYANSEGKLTVDSHMLSHLMDYGFVGFAVFYGLFAYAIVKAFQLALRTSDAVARSLSVACAIALVEFVVIKSVLSSEANHSLVFMVLGGIVALHYHERNRQRSAAPCVLRSSRVLAGCLNSPARHCAKS